MKKGFTLIELLAVIVILAIIALISTPLITGIISKSIQNAFAVDTSAIFRAIEYKKMENDKYDFSQVNVDNIRTELNVNKASYKLVKIKQLSNEDFMVVVKGENRWRNLVAYGTDDNIQVIDTTSKQYDNPPTIIFNGSNPLNVNINDEYVELGATAHDEAGNELDVYISGTVNINQFGQNTITYYAIDGAGNETEVTRTVNVTIVKNFIYAGNYETWVVPTTGRYKIETFGAQGGGNGGQGGYAYGEINLTAGQSIYGFVGGQGESGIFYSFIHGGGGKGGFNGGGNGGVSQDYYNRPVDDPLTRAAGGGGGATDIRIGGINLANRVIVAGGGGGHGYSNTNLNYGIGGGIDGTKGLGFATTNVEGGNGGTQTAGGTGAPDPGGSRQVYHAATSGTLSIGGIGSSRQVYGDNAGPGGGGGGGYYGGGGGGSASSYGRGGMGGGGSSYIGGMINDTTRGTTAGINLGNGKIIITLISQ